MTRIASLKKKLYLTVAKYFRFFANISLQRWRPRVIAVTGSVGKTTLLNLIEVQLGERAHYSHNANSAYGIAFDILGLDGVRGSKLKWIYLLIITPFRALTFTRTQELYVVEIDGERPHETEFLASWLRPEVTLWVSVGKTHAVWFDGQVRAGQFETVEDAILHEFSYLPKYTSKLVVYNSDHDLIEHTMSKIKTVDTQSVNGSELTSYKAWPNRTEFVVDKTTYIFNHPMPREVSIQLSLLQRLAEYLGVNVKTDLSEYKQPPGRSNYYEGKGGTQLIDSSYNAHLMSVDSIVNLYKEIDASHKWIVIGDIVEQGDSEAEEHRKLGVLLREAEFERYILVGRRTQEYTYPELDPIRAVTFLHPKDALVYLENTLTGDEVILFKGSQYLEGIVEHLLANPDDVATLPRQEPAAKKRRARWGL